MEKFRLLHADEIECKVGSISSKGLSLLLYKDARVDQNILDDTVGQLNWKKDYQLIDGQLFCTISIWDSEKSQWVTKQDVGVESNTEAEKGRASDAQKRAAFAWGIGRELYSAPFIWIPAESCKSFKQANNGKFQCYDKFYVEQILYDEKRNIVALAIKNRDNGSRVFCMDNRKKV